MWDKSRVLEHCQMPNPTFWIEILKYSHYLGSTRTPRWQNASSQASQKLTVGFNLNLKPCIVKKAMWTIYVLNPSLFYVTRSFVLTRPEPNIAASGRGVAAPLARHSHLQNHRLKKPRPGTEFLRWTTNCACFAWANLVASRRNTVKPMKTFKSFPKM